MERIHYSRWISSVALFLITFGLLAFLVSPTLESIFSRWLKFDESYSHGFLLLLVSAYIVGRKWYAQRPITGFYPFWCFPFVLALAGYTLGGILRVEALQELVLVPMILSILAILIGWNQVQKFILPIGLLIFALPFWDYLSWTLQLITVAVNEIGLGFLDIDFRIDGIYVFLTGIGAFEVANGCSGLRYLLVGQSLALLYGELNLRKIRSRIILFLVAIGLALFANWVRVFIIIYMGYETNMQSSLIEDHDNFGWWVFAVTLIPLFLLGRKLENSAVEQAADKHMRADEASPAPKKHRYAGVALVSVFLIAAFFALPSNTGEIKEVPANYDLRLDQEQYGPLFASDLEGWRPQIRNPDRVYQQTLFERAAVNDASDGMPEVFYAAIHSYDFQRQGAEVVQYGNRLYDSEEWRLTDLFNLEGPDSRRLSGITLQQRFGDKKVHIAYGYYVEAHWESDELRAKLSQLAGFFNGRSDGSQITFGVYCRDCDGVEALSSFIDRNLPVLLDTIDAQYKE
ncbi:exosortase [Marinobacter confluentis]|uniref:exosortase n=1 Tax=Marinobacter confluentis TaxID=1697557 RepID=UPI00143DAFE8|nr:exosortase [Marinobacter confluentis]